jgi:para-aminobenzoate synthetase / 4-amino-4-deoxychorismate lyase
MRQESALEPNWSKIAALEPGSIVLERAFSRDGFGRSLLFRSPRKIIEARDPGEIQTGLLAIETALSEGLWVAGYISYEAGYALEPSLAELCQPLPDGSPLLWLGCYDAPQEREESVACTVAGFESSCVDLRYALTSDAYIRKVEAIRARIERGETYQANLTMNVHWSTGEEASEMYDRLLQAQPVRYAALLHPQPGWHLLSLSPELFFAREGNRIMTRPMKGTASPGLDAAESRQNAEWLRTDEKNRAENLMIVDLLRNDLGRICKVGSIQVTGLFDVERYPTVLQMTSSIEGLLREGIDYADIFRALFPSGSIVGAPKIRTMRLLREIEQRPRGVYTGSIGYMAPGGVAEFNVAIRTASLRAGEACLGVGSGILYDSSPALEYEECKTKTKFLMCQPEQDFGLIETLLLEKHSYALHDEHLDRMRQSAEYFQMNFDVERFESALEGARRASSPADRTRVRLLLRASGEVTWTASPLARSDNSGLVILLATERTDPADRFVRHKTTRRSLYDQALQSAKEKGYDDVLFRNVHDEITECAIRNLVVGIEGRMFTPPVRSGLLPGVYRGRMLHDGRVAERVLMESDVARAEAVYICNSVHGLRRVAQIDKQRESADPPTTIWSCSAQSGEPLPLVEAD